jgi:hypothetical protein
MPCRPLTRQRHFDNPARTHTGFAMNRFMAYDDELTPYAILRGMTDDGASRCLMTEDGRQVMRIDRGEYDIICPKGKIRVWSDDPNGP